MQKAALITDVQDMTDRFMIVLFKKKIREIKLDPKALKGTWSEASSFLEAHFGKISRIMDNNEFKLLSLYLKALKELRGD